LYSTRAGSGDGPRQRQTAVEPFRFVDRTVRASGRIGYGNRQYSWLQDKMDNRLSRIARAVAAAGEPTKKNPATWAGFVRSVSSIRLAYGAA
jgi:hypothetical protein